MKHRFLMPCAAVILSAVAGAQTIVHSFPTGGVFSGGLEIGNNTVWVADETAVMIREFTRTGTPVKSYPSPNTLPIGVGYDPNTGMIWVGDEAEILYEVNPATGVPTGIQFSTVPHITDLSGVALDPISGNIFVSQDSAPQKIVEFTQAGAMVVLINIQGAGSTDPDGLGYNYLTDTFFTGEDLGDRILEIDRNGMLVNSWNTAVLGISPEGVGVDTIAGTVFVSAGTNNTVYELGGIIQRNPATFCTAKTGLMCGVPSISSSGTPSATALSGFKVQASPAVSCRSGILLYNTAKAAAAPFQGGVLCLAVSGLRRAGSTNSMGTPGNNCDGLFSIDMNQFAHAMWVVPDCAGGPSGIPPNNPAAYLTTPGTRVSGQFWGRDTMATGSFVSDGLIWVIGP
jgi:hypothetical protein